MVSVGGFAQVEPNALDERLPMQKKRHRQTRDKGKATIAMLWCESGKHVVVRAQGWKQDVTVFWKFTRDG